MKFNNLTNDNDTNVKFIVHLTSPFFFFFFSKKKLVDIFELL